MPTATSTWRTNQARVNVTPAKQLTITALLAALLLVVTSARAQLWTYAIATDRNLYKVDLATAAKTLIGPTGAPIMEGLAVSPLGKLFGTDYNGLLYSINTATGAALLIGNSSRGDIEGLDFNGSTLLGVNSSGLPTVFSINTANASTISIATAGTITGTTRAMATSDPNDVFLDCDGQPYNTLYKLNLLTGGVTTIGTMSGTYLAAMDLAPDGNLYGLGTEGSLFRIDPNTAAPTLIGNTGGDFWVDMSIPIPEPGSATFLAAAILVTLLSGSANLSHHRLFGSTGRVRARSVPGGCWSGSGEQLRRFELVSWGPGYRGRSPRRFR
jgi:hypothetical protein